MLQKSSLLRIIVIVLILGVGGLGVALGTGIWDPLWSPFRPEPEVVLAKMIKSMKEVKTYHSNILFDLSYQAQTEVQFSAEIKSDLEIRESQKPKQSSNFTFNVMIEGSQYSLVGESKTVNETSYLKLTTIPFIPSLQLIMAMFGIDLNEIKNQWIKFDQESLFEFYKEMGLSEEEIAEFRIQSEEGKETQAKITEIFQEVIKDRKLYLIKEELPNKKINGKDSYRYVVVLDKEEIKKIIPELLDSLKEANNILGSYVDFLDIYGAQYGAKEVAIKSNMMQIQVAAEFIYDEENSYNSLSCNYPEFDVPDICEDIAEQTGVEPVIYTSDKKYCAYASLTVPGYYYCADSRWGGRITTDPGKSGYCNGETFICPDEVEIPEEERRKIAKEEFSKELDDFFEKISEIKAELWIGKKDKLLYEIKGEKEIDLSKFGETGKVTIGLKVDFSNFSQELNIESPKEFKTIKDILAERAGLFSPLLGSRELARDATRKADIRQILTAMEMYYTEDDHYLQSKTMPASIGTYMSAVPKDPLTESSYNWLDNTYSATTGCDGMHYCFWAELEAGGYIVASEKGVKELSVKPTRCPCW